MKIEQIYTGCLAQGAYYITSESEAVIIDPLREVQPYIDRATRDGVKIKYIFETHFHADFVSGHVTLSEKTGAPIVYGPQANPQFEHISAIDGQVFEVGNVSLTVLHTPGHTMESSTYLLKDAEGKEIAIFTGDTLFLGDVGRPDLAQKADDMTQEDLAGLLYESLRNKIMKLPDSVTVYPAHGAGSACGKNMMKETVDSLGNQKKMNYALRADMSKEEFIAEVTEGLQAPPAYFPLNVQMNKEGYESIDDVLASGTQAYEPLAFYELAKAKEAIVLDVRSVEAFKNGHIPGSIFIGLDGSFAPWVGALVVDVQQPLLLVCPEGREEEAVTRLARVGFDQTLGYLKGGVKAWEAADQFIDTLETITAEEMEKSLGASTIPILDVRKPGEYNADHLPMAQHIPLSELSNRVGEIPDTDRFYIHCAGGYRSVIASSILKARGHHNMVDVIKGYAGIKKTNLERKTSACSV